MNVSKPMDVGAVPAKDAGGFRSLKTLFIIVDSGAAIRNILRTRTFEILKGQNNLRLVIFSPIADDDFRKEFAAPNVIIEPMPKWKGNFVVRSLRSYRKDVWSEFRELMRYREKRQKRKQRLRRKILDLFLGTPATPEEADRLFHKLERWEKKYTPPQASEYFEKYRPDLVFFTTMYTVDLSLEIGAEQRGVETCAFILSWDNPTTKGPFPVHPDTAIVWNTIMRDEVVKFHNMPAQKIFVSGPPQFDLYLETDKYCSRDEFFKKWKLDPAKRLITYTTGSVQMFPFEHEVVEQLYAKLQEGAFGEPCQLMVRLHPKDIYEPYRKFDNKPGLVLQMPGRKANTRDYWNPSREDMYGLGETMLYSDVILNIASTITIDAAALDKPVVNVGWDGFTNKPANESCVRIYGWDHYKKIVETGGITMAYTPDEAVAAVRRYLANPSLEAEGRARIREQQCYKLDGNCAKRIADYLIERLKQQEASK